MPTTSPETRRCPHCGARVAQQADTCLLCGQRIRNSTYLTPALALLAVAVIGGIIIAGLRDRSSGNGATNTPPAATAMALAPATVPTTPDTPAGETSPPPTATVAPPTATPTAAPTETETPTPTPTETPVPTVGPRVHLVKSGDVLGTIAQEYGLEVDDVLAVNPNLTEYSMLRVGQEITIPGGSSAVAATEPAGPAVHVIESGDNLAYLAETYDTTVADILAVNPGLSVNSLLRVGQEIILPGGAGEAAAPAAAPEPQSFVHTLQSGESIGYLANQYDTTTDAILAANPGITRWTVLSVGQEIVIPVPPPSGGPEPEPTATPSPLPTATPANSAAIAAVTALPTTSLMSMGGPAQPRAVEALSPGGGAQVKPNELILMWTGAGDLSSDLYYVVHVWRVGDPSDTLTGWTRANSWRPTEDLIARWGAGAHLYWDVGIGREIAVAGSGQPRFEPAGVRTQPQDFYVVAQ